MKSHANTMACLRDAMTSRFGTPPDAVRFVWAPYRICPLGAHIDHQLGTVTAMAIDHGVFLAFAPSRSSAMRLTSLSFAGEVGFHVDDIPPRRPGDWGNYARGAAAALNLKQHLTDGIVGVTSGGLAEVGLSSSASIGLAYLLALEDVNGMVCSPSENVRLDQFIENHYLGLNNGILDQTAVLLSRRDHLTVIDCKAFAQGSSLVELARTAPSAMCRDTASLQGESAPGVQLVGKPATMPPFSILLAFSGVTQPILSTDYNRRVAECEEAAGVLLRAAGRAGAPARLAEVSQAEYARHCDSLAGNLARRATHFFSEMDRVRSGVRAWQAGDLHEFGRLVSQSGHSSVINYECGCAPMISLHEILTRTDGVLGARFSGAGFRGCCLALLEPQAETRVVDEVQRAYAACCPEWAPSARFILCQSADGARIL